MLEILIFTLGLFAIVIIYVGGVLWMISDYTDDELDEVFKNVGNFDNNNIF